MIPSMRKRENPYEQQAAGGAEGLLPLASAFGSLKLGQGMIAKFVPVVLGFVKNQGGDSVMKLLQGVLKV
jgi:hypothetical protein